MDEENSNDDNNNNYYSTTLLVKGLDDVKWEGDGKENLSLGQSEEVEEIVRQCREYQTFNVISAKNLNVYDILAHDNLIITKSALKFIENKLSVY